MSKTKTQVWAEVESRAQVFREKDPTLTQAQACDRVWNDNADLRAAYYEAANDPPAAPEVVDEWAGRGAEKIVLDRINAKAAELRARNPQLTEAQAFTGIWTNYPDAREKLRQAQALDRMDTGRAATKTTTTEQRSSEQDKIRDLQVKVAATEARLEAANRQLAEATRKKEPNKIDAAEHREDGDFVCVNAKVKVHKSVARKYDLTAA
jgi:hypothetical protein